MRQPDKYHKSEESFTFLKCKTCVEWAGDHCSWFNVNQSTVDENMRENYFLDFRSQWSWHYFDL